MRKKLSLRLLIAIANLGYPEGGLRDAEGDGLARWIRQELKAVHNEGAAPLENLEAAIAALERAVRDLEGTIAALEQARTRYALLKTAERGLGEAQARSLQAPQGPERERAEGEAAEWGAQADWVEERLEHFLEEALFPVEGGRSPVGTG